LLTRAVDLEYEKYCLFFYEQALCYLKISLEKGQPLEGDEHVYANSESISWEQKMALLYRIEKKRIVRNQIDLLGYFR